MGLYVADGGGILHFPSLGDIVRVAEGGGNMPQAALHAPACPLQVVGARACGQSGKERSIGLVGVFEVISRCDGHVAHLHGLVLVGAPPPGINEGGFSRQSSAERHLYRYVDKGCQVVEQVGLDEKDGARGGDQALFNLQLRLCLGLHGHYGHFFLKVVAGGGDARVGLRFCHEGVLRFALDVQVYFGEAQGRIVGPRRFAPQMIGGELFDVTWRR